MQSKTKRSLHGDTRCYTPPILRDLYVRFAYVAWKCIWLVSDKFTSVENMQQFMEYDECFTFFVSWSVSWFLFALTRSFHVYFFSCSTLRRLCIVVQVFTVGRSCITTENGETIEFGIVRQSRRNSNMSSGVANAPNVAANSEDGNILELLFLFLLQITRT